MNQFIDELKSHFAQSFRNYIKENLENPKFLNQIFENLCEIKPLLIKNGMKEDNLSNIESKDDFYNLLKKYSENELENLNLTSLEVLSVLENHELIMLKEKPSRVFLVGSFASGKQHQESDIDILLEVRKRSYSSDELEEKYRTKIKSYFMKNNIREKNDSIHPQIRGRRVDVYFTYDADLETRPKIQLY